MASLSLDLDNLWAYQMTHGDEGWDSYPTYLRTVVPRVSSCSTTSVCTITVFIVGQDAALERNRQALASIAEAGHEIGNHSFRHQPWLHRYSPDELRDRADRRRGGRSRRPPAGATVGFRGPGYSLSPTVLADAGRPGLRGTTARPCRR